MMSLFHVSLLARAFHVLHLGEKFHVAVDRAWDSG